MQRQPIRIALGQINALVGDIEGNVDRLLDCARRVQQTHSVDLVVFPELALLGYPPEDLLLRPGLWRRIEQAEQRIRDEHLDCAVVFGSCHRDSQGRRFNTAVCIDHEQRTTRYCKQVLPNYGVFDEKRYFEAGREPALVTVRGWRIGLTVCEDIWQPGPARQCADAGAELIVNLNASPYHLGKRAEREQILARRVAETGLPIIYVNLIGGQDELVFDGGSMLVNAHGAFVARAPVFEATELVLDLIDGDEAQVIDGAEDRAPSEHAEIYQALVLGVRDYVAKNGFNGAVIGLSGGIDSALTLALAVDALGPQAVQAVLMPSRYTAQMSIDDAEAQARSMGVESRIIPIEPAFNTFLDLLAEAFAGRPADVTEENIQARCRGVILMALSNKFGRILLTTGNKSEMAVGYATLYGDMAGGFAPLKDVPKTLVYALAEYRNTVSPAIPERVISRPPSAELAADQKDEDSLPPYPVLDEILRLYVEQDLAPESIVERGFDAATVHRVVRLVITAEYKRRQAPPGVRVTTRAFGRDRRYPITSGYHRQGFAGGGDFG